MGKYPIICQELETTRLSEQLKDKLSVSSKRVGEHNGILQFAKMQLEQHREGLQCAKLAGWKEVNISGCNVPKKSNTPMFSMGMARQVSSSQREAGFQLRGRL